MVRNIATRVAVFEKGELIELDTTENIFNQPQHEYTRRLIRAVPLVSDEEVAHRDSVLEKYHASL